MKYPSIFFLFFATAMAIGQNIESEIGFVFMKAEYLLETDRYGEAIDEYTKVINADPTYKDAIVKRAQAKYAMYSYQGARADIIQSIKAKGIDAESVKLLGLSNHHMGNHQEAIESLILAHKIFPKNTDIISALATSAMESLDPNACNVLQKVNSTNTIAKYIVTVCNSIENPKTPRQRNTSKSNTKTQTTKPSRTESTTDAPLDDIITMDSPNAQSAEQEPVEVIEEEVVDDVANEIVIDEDLTVVVKNGLGSRRIIDQPSILLLSEKAGQVTVDICVSKAGRVESAEINESETNINTDSLKSLALRKAKEFWFGRDSEECGTIVLVINGG